MALPKPKLSLGSTSKNALRGSMNLGARAFKNMFPTLGRFIAGSDLSKSGRDNTQTQAIRIRENLDDVLSENNSALGTIFNNQNQHNAILDQILSAHKALARGVAPPSGGSDMPDLPIMPVRRQRPGTRPTARPTATQAAPATRNSKWTRFLNFLKRRANTLYTRVATKLVTSASLATIPALGWIAAALTLGFAISDVYLLYSLWQEFSGMSEEEQESAGRGEPLAETNTTAELQQEAARENLSDVSRMGETQNLNAGEQQVLTAQTQQSERRREQAGIAENLEDPVRQNIMERLARAEAALHARNTPSRASAVQNIRNELEQHNRRNPISPIDASRTAARPEITAPVAPPPVVAPPPPPPSNNTGAVASPPVVAPPPAPPPPATTPVLPVAVMQQPIAERVATPSLLSDNLEKILFEADLIKFDGAFNIPQATSISQPSVSSSFGSSSSSSGVTPQSMQISSGTPMSPGAAGSGATGPAADPGSQPMQISNGTPMSPGATGSGGGVMSGGSATQSSQISSGSRGSAAATIQFFVSKGWTPAQAAGFAANLEVESSFDPNAVGDGGRAYGIAQWHPPRQAAFEQWAGRPIRGSTVEQQLEFMNFELTQGTERGAGNRIRQTTTPEQAAAIIDQFYERSNGHARARRMQLAASYAAGGATMQPQQQVVAASSSGSALTQASTARVSANRNDVAQAAQRITASLDQQPHQGRRQAPPDATHTAQSTTDNTEVPLKTRILSTFDQLARVS